jgi:suppressor of fused-like protein
VAKKKPAPPASDAPGWDAIDAACAALYPDQPEPLHYPITPHPPLGTGLVYGISAYRAKGPPAHWHYVTYGFSDLYEKTDPKSKLSGWGFELTLRVTRGRERTPPSWALGVLNNLSIYVRRSGNWFGSGHTVDLNGPICLGADTLIRAIAFAPDPQLGTIDTPNGRAEFLQVVGLALDEHEACGDWRTAGVLDLLRETDPLLVTDLARASLLSNPSAAKRIQEGIDRDGSLSDRAFVAKVEWEATGRGASRVLNVTLGARAVESLLPKLRSRLAHGRDFALVGSEQVVRFRAAKAWKWAIRDGTPALDLSPAGLAALQKRLKVKRGRYEFPELPGAVFTVVPSEITDGEGRVVEVVG